MISIIHPPTDAVEFVPIGSGIDAFCQTIHRRITSLRMPNQGMNGSSKVVHGFFQHHYYPSNLLYHFQQYGRPIRLHCQNTNSSLWWITKNVSHSLQKCLRTQWPRQTIYHSLFTPVESFVKVQKCKIKFSYNSFYCTNV